MDSFDIDTVDKYVKQYKRKIVSKLETYNLKERDLKSHSELLSLVLEYSPRGIDERKVNEKYLIKTISPEVFSKAKSRTYLIEKQVSSGSNSSDEEKDIKSSKFSSKLNNNNKSITKNKSNNEKEDNENNIRFSIMTKMNNDIKAYVRNFIYDTIYNVFINSKKFQKEIQELEDDEEDEYFGNSAIERRKSKNSIVKNTYNSRDKKKSASKFGDEFMVKVYLFKTKTCLELALYINETVFDLKNKLIERFLKDKSIESKFKLTFFKPDAYEIRMIEDDDDDFLPNMDFAGFDDKLNIFKSGHKDFSITERNDYDPTKEKPQLLGNHQKGSETRIFLRIFLKYETEKNESTVINESGEKTLKNVLETLAQKKKLPFKNSEYFYFVEHHESNKNTSEMTENEIIDNEINLETQLKYLNFFELDLNLKKFQDVPESTPISLMSNYIHEFSVPSSQKINTDNQNEEVGRDYIFNDINAGIYQEFEVIKINPYKSKQERVLGIDRYNITNNMPKTKIQASIMNFFYGGTKRPLRKTNDVVDCDYQTNKSFFIALNDDGITKKVIYQVKSVNVRNEIVAKLKYIVKMNQMSENTNK